MNFDKDLKFECLIYKPFQNIEKILYILFAIYEINQNYLNFSIIAKNKNLIP